MKQPNWLIDWEFWFNWFSSKSKINPISITNWQFLMMRSRRGGFFSVWVQFCEEWEVRIWEEKVKRWRGRGEVLRGQSENWRSQKRVTSEVRVRFFVSQKSSHNMNGWFFMFFFVFHTICFIHYVKFFSDYVSIFMGRNVLFFSELINILINLCVKYDFLSIFLAVGCFSLSWFQFFCLKLQNDRIDRTDQWSIESISQVIRL